MSTTSTEVATPPPTARSAVANGSRLWIDSVDGRSAEARRFRDVLGDLVQHLGGDDAITEPQRHLARRAAALVTWCERAEISLAKGNDMDVGQYVTASNSLRRLLADIGIERQPRDMGNLAEHLKHLDAGGDKPVQVEEIVDPRTEARRLAFALAIGGLSTEPPETSHGDETPTDTSDSLSPLPEPPEAQETTAEPEAELEPQIGDAFTIPENGATVTYVEMHNGDRRWLIADAAGQSCANRETREDAVEFARCSIKAPQWWSKDLPAESEKSN